MGCTGMGYVVYLSLLHERTHTDACQYLVLTGYMCLGTPYGGQQQ